MGCWVCGSGIYGEDGHFGAGLLVEGGVRWMGGGYEVGKGGASRFKGIRIDCG